MADGPQGPKRGGRPAPQAAPSGDGPGSTQVRPPLPPPPGGPAANGGPQGPPPASPSDTSVRGLRPQTGGPGAPGPGPGQGAQPSSGPGPRPPAPQGPPPSAPGQFQPGPPPAQPGQPGQQGPAEPEGPKGPSLKDRVKSRLDSFRTEHRANAEPEGSEPIQMGKPVGATETAPPADTTEAAPAPRKRRPPRRARLRLTRVDPWSVMKTAFLLSIAFAIVSVVAVLMVWTVLDAAGVWESINATVKDTIGGEETQNFNIENYLGLSRVLGFTMLVAAIDVVLLTALFTLGAFLYNMAAALLGGVELTLAEDDH